MKAGRNLHRIAIWCVLSLFATQAHAQKVGLKTNTLYWAVTTPNLGLEIAMSSKNHIGTPWGLQSLDIYRRQEDAFLARATRSEILVLRAL